MIVRNHSSSSKLVCITADNRRQLTVHVRQHIFVTSSLVFFGYE